MIIDEQTILRYLNNASPEEEAAAVHAYLTEHPEVLEKYLPLEEIENMHTGQIDLAVTTRMWHHIRGKTATARIFKSRFVRTMAAAAAVVAVLFFSYKIIGPPAVERTEIKQPVAKAPTPEIKKAHIANESQAVQNVLLADGSVVKLYPHSSMEYDEPFGQTNRQLNLNGKAFFDVKKKQAQPFVVTAAFVNVTVLGTRFTVNEMVKNKDKEVTVHLFTGKIMLTHLSKDKTVYMMPGEVMHIDKHGLHTVSPKKQIQPVTTLSTMEFKEMPLGEVLPQLEQHFGITIKRSDGNIDKIIFSGSFQKTEKPTSVLQAIALAGNLEVSQTDDGFILTQ